MVCRSLPWRSVRWRVLLRRCPQGSAAPSLRPALYAASVLCCGARSERRREVRPTCLSDIHSRRAGARRGGHLVAHTCQAARASTQTARSLNALQDSLWTVISEGGVDGTRRATLTCARNLAREISVRCGVPPSSRRRKGAVESRAGAHRSFFFRSFCFSFHPNIYINTHIYQRFEREKV